MKTKRHRWFCLNGRKSKKQSKLMVQINVGAFLHGFLDKIIIIFIIR